MRIKCVTLDLDDTLWDCPPVLQAAEATFYAWLAKRHRAITRHYTCEGLVAQRREFFARFPELRHDFTWLRKRWLADLGETWGCGEGFVEDGFAVFWRARNEVELFDCVPAVLERLRARYRLGAITNGNACVYRIGIGHHFDFVVTAAVAGALKPDPAIFRHALALSGAAAHEAVHVGDDPVTDVAGAAGAGMRTVWVNNRGLSWQGSTPPDAQVASIDELDAVLRAWQADQPREL